MPSKLLEDFETTTSIIYLPQSISLNEVGFARIQFFFMTWYLLICSSLYILMILINQSQLYNFYPLGLNFSFFIISSTSISHYIVFTLIGIFLYFLSFLMVRFGSNENVSWNGIYYFGHDLISADLLIAIFTIIFVLMTVLNGTINWFFIFIVQFALLTIFVNRFFSKVLSKEFVDQSPSSPDTTGDIEPDESIEEGEESIDNFHVQTYSWSSKYGGVFEIRDFRISNNDYVKCQKINQEILTSTDGYYTDSQDYIDRVQKGLSTDVRRLSRIIGKETKNKSSLQVIDVLLSFVHSPNFRYEYDIVTKGFNEYARFPIETLVDRVGDCDCLSILAATIFKLHGYNSALIIVKTDNGLHCVAGVEMPNNIIVPGTWAEKNGKRYFYCEATGSGWAIGESPNVKPEEVWEV